MVLPQEFAPLPINSSAGCKSVAGFAKRVGEARTDPSDRPKGTLAETPISVQKCAKPRQLLD
jgi:hypothetical protein